MSIVADLTLDESKICHALVAGKPLCGFSDEPPANWPDGHIWTYRKNTLYITCPECSALASDQPSKEESPKRSKRK